MTQAPPKIDTPLACQSCGFPEAVAANGEAPAAERADP